MIEIELSKYSPTILENNSTICNVRKRLIHNIPEEIVRQSFINYLVTEKGYPIDRFEIEVPLSRTIKGKKGRADLLVYDYEGRVLCLIECKRPNEVITDNVFNQILRYNEILNAETLCIVAGNDILFYGFNDLGEFVLFSEIPSYKTLIEKGTIEYYEFETFDFEKFEYNDENINHLINYGVFGENTDKKYFPFLLNLYNFYLDEDDVLEFSNDKYKDIGIKNTKFGNASGGSFFGDYRSFLKKEENIIVSFSISSMTRGDGFPAFTSLMFAVEEKGHFHLSLQIKVEKHINFDNNFAIITHDGTITVGKLGSAKRSELINFVEEHKPELLKNGSIYLGKFDLKQEINKNSEDIKQFVENCIEYSIIRDEFRRYKKGCR